MNKVHLGTPKGSHSMCLGCRNAHVMRGLNLQHAIICRAMGKPVPFPVETCSQYDDKSSPPLYEMQNIAWEVAARNRGPVGFGENATKLEIVITPPKKIMTQEPPSTSSED